MSIKVYLSIMLASVFAVLIPTSNADLIIGDAKLSHMGVPEPSVMLLTENLAGGLSVLITDQGGGSFEFATGFIAMSYRLFSATPGLEFDPIYASNWQSALIPGTSIQVFSTNETKYYAYWEETELFEPDPDPNSVDNYGWVSLTYTGTDLVITDSATAFGGGIIVGAYTQIPEPSSVLLLAFGAISLWRRMRSG